MSYDSHMNNNLSIKDLKVEVCLEEDWKEILDICKETEMHIWLTGKEEYQKFYVVKDPVNKELILCFTFSQEGDVGILKNFICKKKYQGKGLGLYVANNLISRVAKDKGIKKLYLHGNDRPPYTSNHFWKKTVFTHINSSAIKDEFYKQYFDNLVKNYSNDVLCIESIFYLNLS